ncbi:uncharacterized protein K452DRAFT_283753 [Aplosporella prunicola CBS 121167]|uniref:3'-phosphate/5'-hydroxy nucleic acid ligase n=1 Tax=Aplosporella prunicola CBS 121167 TaxID=1176127 RepID=A0A6A6BPL2_9PEZI|nr:uncharacterized protein K452DRAFT_283753 [Aplosporella prunicola CBS 121167]KAF2145393.1 hypothetical protein K452DRAFT_283753 [Aplosporella prunicola CBS 121167]
MGSMRLTIALNSNRNLKSVLLLNAATSFDPADPASVQSLVLKSAQSKLRLKLKKGAVGRIFAARNGTELLTTDDWKREAFNDAVLLLSVGEDFVGLKKATSGNGTSSGDGSLGAGNPNCGITILADSVYVDQLSITQLETTARTLPGIIHAVGQPDLHPGTKFPIGAVFVSQEYIHPPLIGGDIGCGMSWYKTTLSRSQVDGDKATKVVEKLRGLEGPWRSQSERVLWLTEDGTCSSVGKEWDASLGTIGAGNHFAEIQVVEEVQEEVDFKLDDVVLLVHSGSRGYGGDILKRYTSEGHTSLRVGEEATNKYLEEHDKACTWAQANRDLIALRFLACLEPGESAWELGRNDSESQNNASADIKAARARVQQRKVVDIWHNNVQRVVWPPQPPSLSTTLPQTTTAEVTSAINELSIANADPSTPTPTHAYIHRKGAAPTTSPTTALPLAILPLPGSRATPTAILSPAFSDKTAWGASNGLSLAHGAGRAMSRAKALSSLSSKYKNDAHGMLQPGKVAGMAAGAAAAAADSSGSGGKARKGKGGSATAGGTWVVCEDKQLVWEEAPEAYKDVVAVAEDLVRAGVAEVRGWCVPRISYKVRDE